MKATKGDLLVDANGVKKDPIILIEGDKIVEAGSSGNVSIPTDAEVIDAGGLGLEENLGTLEAGKLADIIAVGENPLEDIKSLQERDNIKLVMKAGEVYKNTL